MNDKDIADTVKHMLENRALTAPGANGLLDTVKARSRKRGILRRATAGASALAVTGVAALLVGQTLQPAAGGETPEFEGVRVCVGMSDGVPERLLVAQTLDGDNGDAGEVVEVDWSGGNSEPVELAVEDSKYKVTVKGWDVPIKELPLEDTRDVEIGEHDGLVGVDAQTGERMVGFETGKQIADVDLTLTVAITDGTPGEKWLLEWANSITVHTDTKPCEV